MTLTWVLLTIAAWVFLSVPFAVIIAHLLRGRFV